MSEEISSPSPQGIQAELATTRTLLALDRTLLAWVRTSLSLNAFGFTLAKFMHDLIVTGSFRGIDPMYPRTVGMTLMLLGLTGLVCGICDYRRSAKNLKGAVIISPWSASLVVSLLLALINLLLIVDLIMELKVQ
jgi:putative membrane protein